MRRQPFRKPDRTVVVRSIRMGAIVAIAATALAAYGHSGQGDRWAAPDFDPAKKGAWRFLDDDLGKRLEQGASAYGKGDY